MISRKERLHHIISNQLNPFFLEVYDESQRHHVPQGAETHFKIIIIAEQFKNLSRIKRHRLIHSLLTEEFNQGMHALSLSLYTPAEWEIQKEHMLSSPRCHDGYIEKM